MAEGTEEPPVESTDGAAPSPILVAVRPAEETPTGRAEAAARAEESPTGRAEVVGRPDESPIGKAEVVGRTPGRSSFTRRRSLPRDQSIVQQELDETVGERQAFETRLKQLRAQIRLCEASYEALLQRERLLTQEVAAADLARGGGPLPPLAPVAAGPRFFTMAGEGDISGTSQGAPEITSFSGDGDWWDDEETSQHDSHDEGQDMEDVLDHVGVARCRQCGIRLPLDVTAIEEHCSTCFDTAEDVDADSEGAAQEVLYGKCCHCGKQMPLSTEGIENHACTGRAAEEAAAAHDQPSVSPRTSSASKPAKDGAKAKAKSRLRGWWHRSPARSSGPDS